MAQTSRDSSSAGDVRQQTEIERLAAIAQHQLNNPLAAMLAELQLLEMEPTLGEQHRAAVHRLTGLLRRVIQIVHDLDKRIVDGQTG